mmetsp:Transcript_59134/g.69143  ORF Transcript_59134/g.69143 Transcript_59134/m.69143 type:complete len:145 (+) Transcript_59134:3457-3891(+)
MTIENNKIIFKTFEKEINPNQYIPSNSVHPKSSLKGPIFRSIHRYFNQNTKKLPSRTSAKNSTTTFVDKDTPKHKLIPSSSKLAQKLSYNPQYKVDKYENMFKKGVNVYFHKEYHLCGFSKQQIHDSIQTTRAPFSNSCIKNDK